MITEQTSDFIAVGLLTTKINLLSYFGLLAINDFDFGQIETGTWHVFIQSLITFIITGFMLFGKILMTKMIEEEVKLKIFGKEIFSVSKVKEKDEKKQRKTD